jgi:hypothetical protein
MVLNEIAVVDGGKSLFCFAKKVTKKGEPAAPPFVLFFCR